MLQRAGTVLLLASVLLLLISCGSTFWCGGSFDGFQSITASGVVYDPGGRPIPNAHVEEVGWRSASEEIVTASAVTDASGHYEIEFTVMWWNERGRFGYQDFTLRARADGYTTLERTFSFRGKEIGNMRGIDFRLSPP